MKSDCYHGKMHVLYKVLNILQRKLTACDIKFERHATGQGQERTVYRKGGLKV